MRFISYLSSSSQTLLTFSIDFTADDVNSFAFRYFEKCLRIFVLSSIVYKIKRREKKKQKEITFETLLTNHFSMTFTLCGVKQMRLLLVKNFNGAT